jgi:hypothetical protein
MWSVLRFRGGIRSATFNLAVLEGLQELDLLRRVDFLSTVSGGGFIGGWLVGNVRRSRYWLGEKASWQESVSHLRNYSKYLAPRTGLLSMDTWSLGCLWLRNTSLIQLLVLSWTLVAFTIVYLLRAIYWTIAKDVLNSPNGWIRSGTWCGVLCGISVTWIVSKSLTASKRKVSLTLKRLLIAGVIAAWVAL